MAHSLTLKDPLYKNWLLAVLGLKYVKQGLEEFVTQEVAALHACILNDVTSRLSSVPPIDCSTQTYFQIPTKGAARPPVYICDLHNTGDISTCGGQCPNAICFAFIRELKTYHRFSKPIWTNTNPRLWTRNPWEVAKCFLSVGGYDKTQSAVDTDCTGLLSICILVKSIGDTLGISHGDFKDETDVFSKVLVILISTFGIQF